LKPVNIGLLGLGTVGQGVANILSRNSAEIERRTGQTPRIVQAAVRNRQKAESHGFDFSITTDGEALVNNPDVDIVCEMMGGQTPTLDWVRTAIENGKHVITANKALIATHGNELFALPWRAEYPSLKRFVKAWLRITSIGWPA